jgi:hypothetical protein
MILMLPLKFILPYNTFLVWRSTSFYVKISTSVSVTSIDPASQHDAPQLRWLKPPLASNDSTGSYFSFVTGLLNYVIYTFCQVPSAIFPLAASIHYFGLWID